MTGQRWLYRNLLKQSTHFLLFVSMCISVGGFLLTYVRLRGITENIFDRAPPTQLEQINLGIVLTESTKLESNFQHTNNVIIDRSDINDAFISPFLVVDSKEQKSRDLNKHPAGNSTKTFAVVWPCKGSQANCLTNTRYPIEMCRFNSCLQTWTFTEADVVVIYVYRIKQNVSFPNFTRPHHQRWVMLTPEAPSRGTEFAMLDYPALKGQFNWTQSYRLDSDIPWVYGKLMRINAQNKNYENIYRRKNVTAAWFVSHCITPSDRQTYVQRMQTVADIHIYGNCGNYTCADISSSKRALDKDHCLPLLSNMYFFYLAFENSLCKDYVTEKFFKTFGKVDIIPVVRGGTDYKKYFPPGIFVDASDFKYPEDLARFLLKLAKDKTRYISMLKEKSRYRLWPTQRWFCNLCEKMTQDNSNKSYYDLRQWYLQGQCHEPNDM